MAFSAAASGSLSSRAPVRVGGVRKRGEAPDQFDSRMSSSGFTAAAAAPAPMSPQAANIAKARADGTFDAKRNAFNAANSGSHMDSQGNIGPKAPPLPGAMPTTPTPAPASPSPANLAKDSAPLPKPKAPANFDGQSKAGFFGAAMARNGRGSSPIYDDPAVQNIAADKMATMKPSKPSFVAAATSRPPVTRTPSGELVQPGPKTDMNARWRKKTGFAAAAMMN